MSIKIADLRKDLETANAKWTLNENLKDTDVLKTYPTGADLSKAQKVTEISKLDITPFLILPTSNIFLLQQRINRGYIKRDQLSPGNLERLNTISTVQAPAGSQTDSAKDILADPVALQSAGTLKATTSVDWRNRFGWNWLTKIKDQGPCESCWVFSAVGVVEAMTRIEHAVWSLRSEGDVHDGLGAQCATTGSPVTALNWMKTNSVADPVCWPYETTNQPYKPSSDRNGRTVKLDDYVTLSDVQDQKNWLDNVGPISACFTVYNDFFAYGPNSGVYTKANNTVAGGHCIVIVGYDDSKQAWLIRNSWGTSWGMSGYCWFGYGQCDIDSYAKYGVPNSKINPDPWTKRRLHNGNLYESGDGTLHRNFEVWTKAPGNTIRHYWRDGSSGSWALAETVANDCEQSPTVTGTTYNRNFEYVYCTTTNRLHHRWYDQSTKTWNDGGVFGPTNVAGTPGFIQGDYNAPGNFELVVRLSDGTLQHWWRNNGGAFTWVSSATFGSNVLLSGPSLVQRQDRGLDLVCVNNDGTMQRWLRDDAHGGAWKAEEKFGKGIKTSPIMIEGQFNAPDETIQGNYELCVAVNGAIQHWWRDNNGTGNWTNSATFGANVATVLGLIESSYGFDLEVIAELNDGSLQHFWRGGNGWNAGPVFGSISH